MILIVDLIHLYIWVIIVNSVLSFFPMSNPDSALGVTQRWLRRLTAPVLRPIRQVMPRPSAGGMAIDFSPLIAIVLLYVVASII